ncbi:MAG TPA: ion transporter, partial [Saprospiraceae bacterium]|nr:ion transporter [Saprospiraceae bacterium]
KAGHRFDLFITWMIIISVSVVILETVTELSANYKKLFHDAEWCFTFLFTLEYILRIYSSKEWKKYAFSFFGIVDLLSFIPSYITAFFLENQSLLIIRVLRLLRMFRIFKLGHFVSEGAIIANALRASKVKILVFFSFVCIISVFMGSMMYFVERNINPHIQNIPDGIYWAIVTVTTVGYGDSIPVTHLGKTLAAAVMILGYMIIAVPTGIVTAEITNRVLSPRGKDTIVCEHCGNMDHLRHARYCHHCGEAL